MTEQDALARAIEYLGAVEVAPNRFAFYESGRDRWYVTLDRAALETVTKWLDRDLSAEDLQISRERTLTHDCEEMPRGWAPGAITDRQIADAIARHHAVAVGGNLDGILYAIPNGAIHGDTVGPWAIVTEAILVGEHPYLRREAVEMPSWWSPEHRFCQWSDTVGVVVVGSREYCEEHSLPGTYDRFVTASLDDGSEIPA